MPRRVLITCAPPNPNGDLHLGHLSGPFLGADVLRRYLVARGVPVSYVSYTDDHSCYVPRRGAELGWDARTTAFRYTGRIEQTLALAGMSPDHYAHPHRDDRHDAMVRRNFLRLWESGVIVEREVPTPHCAGCGEFRYEAYLRGRCRFCAAPSDGTYCEECGRPQEPGGGVVAGRCIVCGGDTQTRPARRLVVPLAPFADRLAELYQGSALRTRMLEFCRSMLAEGLPELPISRADGYGIPVPLPGWDGHILDTWFSGIFGYLAATEAYGAAHGRPGEWRDLWRDPRTEVVHFIGFDCGFSHAVLWPALLLGLGEYVMPKHVISNEFYTLDGDKFSTSRGHAIWGFDFLREVPADAVRLHLCRTAPEEAKSDFRMAEFDRTVDEVLVGRWEAWAAAVFDLLAKDHGSVVPTVDRADWPAELRALIERLPEDLAESLEPGTFSLRGAAATLIEAVEWAAADLDRRAGSPAELAAHAELLGVVAAVAAPIMPTWSRHTARQLGVAVGFDGVPWPVPGTAVVPAGAGVAGEFRRLFVPRW
jgi:methionyl-tRNA synthetase